MSHSEHTIRNLIIPIVIAIISAGISAYWTVQLQAQQEHRQLIKNLTVLSCANRYTIGTPLMKVGNDSNADWNIRYLTSYYDLVWGDIADEYGTSTPNYATLVSNMRSTNAGLDRIDHDRPEGAARIGAFAVIVSNAKLIDSQFDKLNVNDHSCYNIIAQ